MSNSNEKSHANNASNFVGKVNRIKQEGEAYKPSNPQILITALDPVAKAVNAALLGVSVGNANVTNAILKRKQLYLQLDDYATRAVNMLKSSGAHPDEEAHASYLLSKYRGERIGDVPDEEAIRAKAATAGVTPVIPKVISVSQQGFVNKLSRFTDIVVYLKTIPEYKPNEEELTIAAMEGFITKIGKANDDKDDAAKTCTDAIVLRNTLMTKEPTGAYYLSDKVMKYVAGAHGKKSKFYLDLQKLPVIKMK